MNPWVWMILLLALSDLPFFFLLARHQGGVIGMLAALFVAQDFFIAVAVLGNAEIIPIALASAQTAAIIAIGLKALFGLKIIADCGDKVQVHKPTH